MRIALVNLWQDAPDPTACIARDPLRRELARELARRGHELTVIQEHPAGGTVQDGAVRWVFVKPGAVARGARAALAGRDDAIVKAPAPHLLPALLRARPEAVLCFDLTASATVALLGLLCRALQAPLVLHYHGGSPARSPLLRPIERLALNSAQALSFTTRERGRQWVDSGALRDPARIVEVFETSSLFTPGDPSAARARTGMQGAPALLHVGRLDPVKDPLTVLRAFREIHAARPDATLTLCWTGGALEAEARALARGLPVRWLGRVEAMEDLYRGADALLQASQREVCGRAVLEALACGCPPVLSDIPPFRRLLDGGRIGALFPLGDAPALARAVLALPSPDRVAVRAWFDQALSFPVLARTLEALLYRSRQDTISTGKGRSRQPRAASHWHSRR